MLGETIVSALFQLIEIPTSLGHADHWNVEVAMFHERLESGKNLLVCQVSRCAKKYQSIRLDCSHPLLPKGGFCSRLPSG